MSPLEIVATRDVPAQGGVLAPLQPAGRAAPVSCFAAATDALLTVQLARQATARAAAAYWVGQVDRALAQAVGGYVASGSAGSGLSGSGADMSIAELVHAIG
ncbi:hypothetical protein [Kutzneria buriramensis]|uniref:Uncharacterized protein n=1 Tax=Kutzneria buriramensis TaxID=1045776 RepID=A0A3E0GV95_9PSEU|nr:hypothetical protein [Kutzneria buriramensis]REH26955.1 hypothetical protein BCF44_13110 [Kutzneria buriramensis]